MLINKIKKSLESKADPKKAVFFPKYFKAGKGEYAQGDQFMGVSVPDQRSVTKQFYKEATLKDIESLLKSPIHEHRQTALMLLVYKYEKEKDEKAREEMVKFYLAHIKYANNWDLVDTSARILGWHLKHKDRKLLYKLAKSHSLWEQRIAIVATQMFIRDGEIEDTLKISKLLLPHKHDLIHKAVGWMLREAWTKEPKAVEKFLRVNCIHMPRTTLRYTIEKFPQAKRKQYLEGTFLVL